MRLWHYKVLPCLPDKMLVSQWRECIAIKRQWEKGTLKHRLVSYVLNHPKDEFIKYVVEVVGELEHRDIKYNKKYLDEIIDFCENKTVLGVTPYPLEQNNRYLKQCLYNLQEKADRGIITKEEWNKVAEHFCRSIEE